MEWFEGVLFYLFSAILVIAALRVVIAKNPIHSVLYLVLCFFNGAALWVLLQAEFLAMILMLVYVGAVMVLFLFIIMMMDIDITMLKQITWQNLSIAIVVGGLIIIEMGLIIFRGFFAISQIDSHEILTIGMTAEIGRILFTEYLFQVELAAMLLLVALLGAVALTLRRRQDARYTSAGNAAKVMASDRLRLIHLKAEKVAKRDEKQQIK